MFHRLRARRRNVKNDIAFTIFIKTFQTCNLIKQCNLKLACLPRGSLIRVLYFTDCSKAVLLLWIIYVISVLFLLCFRVRLFIDALWSPAGKGLTYWLSFVMSTCEVVTFPLVSWVRCSAWLYRFLIFALFLTLYCLRFQPTLNTHSSGYQQHIDLQIKL